MKNTSGMGKMYPGDIVAYILRGEIFGIEPKVGTIFVNSPYRGMTNNFGDSQKHTSNLPFLGGQCAVCNIRMAAGDKTVLRLDPEKPGGLGLGVERNCLAKAFAGRSGREAQRQAILFLGKLPLETTRGIVHDVLLSRRLHSALSHSYTNS